MKSSIAIGLSMVAGHLASAVETDHRAWKWEAPVTVDRPGMVRLEIPPAVLDVSEQQNLDDLRILSPAGVETSCVVEIPRKGREVSSNASGFKTMLVGKTTVIEVAPAKEDRIELLELVSPAREFIKSVTIAGRKGDEWQTLEENAVIFRQTGGTERMRISIPEGAWEGFRFTIDDERAQPIPFTGARLISTSRKAATVEYPVVLGERKEVAGETRLTLDLGARNLNMDALQFEIADAVFSRTCTVAFEYRTPMGGGGGSAWADSKIFRVAGDYGKSAEKLVISPDLRRMPVRKLVATIHNDDSPPLAITGVKVRCYPTILIFHASEAGAWRLITGNKSAKHPNYGLSSWSESLATAGGQCPTLGPLKLKMDYQIPAALPGVDPAGAEIGIEKWTRRRAVVPASFGVIRLELDALALAVCQSGLGDVRLVQSGRQIPYLVKPGSVMREMKPNAVLLRNDPKRPTVSRWEILLPLADVPFAELCARSSSPMFSRRLVASIERKDELGNTRSESVGQADWIKSGGVDTPLVINLGGLRMPRTLMLETDHGDNPPISLDVVVLRFSAPSITAKLTDSAPLFLYYGNPGASAPEYDLRLVRNELLSADSQSADLGDEEILKPQSPDQRAIDTGSPWLWAALAGVVAVLLAIVAKLLPARQGV